MPKIYDNIENQLVDGLNETLNISERTDFCVGYFNLRGWKQVAENIDKLSGKKVKEGTQEHDRICRLLVGMQKLPKDILRENYLKPEEIDNAVALKLKKRIAQEFKDQLIVGTPDNQDEKALRQLSQQIKDQKVVVKLHLSHPLHAKLYLCYLKDRNKIEGILGSSNLTFAGLSKQGELNIDVVDQDAANKLAKWFDERWNDRWCIDISKELIEIIDNSWAADKLVSPYHIYIKMAYHLSREARAGINEFKIPKIFQNQLLEFQQKAVLVAAHHLNKRDGVLIGDVVGLGKTITATALAKMFQEDFFVSTLIICPPNLKDMWEVYRTNYELNALVISIGEVQQKLPTMRRFKLLIIDESHNLRNDQASRYSAIKNYLVENDSKVILLTATPYNKSYIDLSNQLRLFISDDKDLGISPERYIESIGGQIQFNSQHTETFIRSIKAFEKSNFTDDWRELMRLYLVRRTRSFIKSNYAETDQINNRKYLTFADGSKSYFPDRIPKKVVYSFDHNDPKDQYAKLYSTSIVDLINELELPRYGLQLYLNTKVNLKATKEEEFILQNLSHAGRRLMGFCRTNLFKRLESSGYSFLLSLSRHILRNYLFVYAAQNNLAIPIGKNISQNLDDFLEDSDIDNDKDNETKNEDEDTNHLNLILKEEIYLKKAKQLYEQFSSDKFKKRFDWIRSAFFDKSFQESLINDSKKILQILHIGKNWDPKEDRQLNALYELINTTHLNEKVLVFTQFADTANYLTEQLKKKGVNQIDCVTGENKNPTELAYRFSPNSNQKSEKVKTNDELRVLISTDVLSEGQNLQDAHIIVNYDLPWAIIRLIQRAGRVDRIGQKSEQILCYSFLPEDGIEKIINLRKRLTQRIEENANVVGSDETFFDGDPINLHDLYNENSGILDGDDDESEVDLASLAYQIWKKATDDNPQLNKIIPDMPNVVYATKNNIEYPDYEGVIIYTRTSEDNDVLTWVDKKGKIITQSQHTILKAAQCSPNSKAVEKMDNHHDLVKSGIDFISDEEINIGGSLGKKTGVKYRVYTRLDSFCKKIENSAFVNENLKKAIDDIYKYPLKESARETLSRQMKAGISDVQLAALLISLREEDKLVINNDDDDLKNEVHIICSLGLKNI